MRPLALVALAGALLATGCARSVPTQKQAEKDETEAETAPRAPGAPPPATPSGVGVAAAPQPGEAAPPKPRPAKIKIVVRSNPPKANVFWGKKNLGPTPVTLERPRDSGPVDLVVRQDGYFSVHTRAYTVRNDAVFVKMTKVEDRLTLFGAKREAAEPAPSATGGAPEGEPPATTAAPPTAPPPSAPPPPTPPQ